MARYAEAVDTCGLRSVAADPNFDVLVRTWRVAIRKGETLPFYEDVALDNLARFALNSALLKGPPSEPCAIVRAGESFARSLCGTFSRELTPDTARAIREAADRAAQTAQPVRTVVHRVRDGLVLQYALLVLPLRNRWGGPLLLACVHELADRVSLVDMIFEASDDGMIAFTPLRGTGDKISDFQIIALNNGAGRLLGRPQQELLWKRLSEIALSLGQSDMHREFAAALDAGQRRRFEVSLPSKIGERHFVAGVVPVGDLISVTLSDVGEIKAREASFRLLFDSSPVPMWLLDRESLSILKVNDAAVLHYGYTRERFLKMSVTDVTADEPPEVTRSFVLSLTDTPQGDRPWRHRKADGTGIEVLPYARMLRLDDRPAVLVSVLDVTERREAEARIIHLAAHDALTQLPNRAQFQSRLEAALDAARIGRDCVAILCLDLDRFKNVNDTLGHPVGDKLLIAVAQRFRQLLEAPHFVARLGGDEFAVIQTGITSSEDATQLATRIIAALGQPYWLDGHNVIVGVSIGIAIAPDHNDDPDNLLRMADMALYQSKANGRNTFSVFEAGMDAELQARRKLESDLRQALPREEFELHYQPIVHAETGRVECFEALLRWRHAEHGLIAPGAFISVAEETGLISPIGEMVLRRACAEAAKWPDGLTVSVNLSPEQFLHGDIVSAVTVALAEADLAPNRLHLEITESVLLEESEINLMVLRRLKDLGVAISMDDFGTGYSSLAYLQRFPIDRIKIDQSFVRDLEGRTDALAILRAIIGLGHGLGITTVAEGVETADQFEILSAEGCTELQGYLFARPMPAQEVIRYLADQGTCTPEMRPARCLSSVEGVPKLSSFSSQQEASARD